MSPLQQILLIVKRFIVKQTTLSLLKFLQCYGGYYTSIYPTKNNLSCDRLRLKNLNKNQDQIIIMDESQKIRIIGFDLGHGEFSLAEVSTDLGHQPQTIEICNQESQITAIGKDKNGNIVIGRNAMRRTDSNWFEISFKKKPSLCSPLDKDNICNFVKVVRQQLKDNQYFNSEETITFFIGCPSGWTSKERKLYQQIMYEAGLKDVFIVSESRAALMHAKEMKKITATDLTKSILIIDVGSSTTDFTWLTDENDHPMDFGNNLGASLIDQAIFQRTLDAHPQKEELTKTFAEYRFWQHRCQFACRLTKEEYFRDPTFYDEPNTFVQGAFENIEQHYQFKPLVNASIMEEILNQPLAQLDNQSWKTAFAQNLMQVKQNLDMQGIALSKILLTGGASRMSFIAQICTKVFPDAPWIRDTQPELAIARGLARWGRIDINTVNFKHKANQIIDNELGNIVDRNLHILVDSQIDELTNGVINQGLKPVLFQWREGDISSVDEFEAKVKRRSKQWLMSEKAKKTITSGFNNWFSIVIKQVENKLIPLYRQYGLSTRALEITTLEVNNYTERVLNSILLNNQFSADFQFAYNRGLNILSLDNSNIVNLIAIELLLAPIGLLAMGLGALGTMIGGTINNQERRMGYLSDQNIQQEIRKYKRKLSEEIKMMFINDPQLEKNIKKQINQILKDGIQEKVDQARLLIVTSNV